jgi:hypothetical protein
MDQSLHHNLAPFRLNWQRRRIAQARNQPEPIHNRVASPLERPTRSLQSAFSFVHPLQLPSAIPTDRNLTLAVVACRHIAAVKVGSKMSLRRSLTPDLARLSKCDLPVSGLKFTAVCCPAADLTLWAD